MVRSGAKTDMEKRPGKIQYASRNRPNPTIARIPGPEVTRMAGLKDALAHRGSPAPESRLGKWLDGWLAGKQGLSGAATDFAHSVDPRTKQGALGLAGMLIPGKGGAEDALAAHLGHSQFRPYQAHTGPNQEGLFTGADQFMHGGMTPQGGADIGYHLHNTSGNPLEAFAETHGYSLPELLGLVASKRIVGPKRISESSRGFLSKPYRTDRGLNG